MDMESSSPSRLTLRATNVALHEVLQKAMKICEKLPQLPGELISLPESANSFEH